MFESMYTESIQENFSQHINSLIEHKSYFDKNINELINNEDIVRRIMLLNASHGFFEDLLQYHQYMNLTDTEIDAMVFKMDDLIDEFESFNDASSNNLLLESYYEKARNFYDLLVRSQIEIGFYKVER